jgi:hypothetical protein
MMDSVVRTSDFISSIKAVGWISFNYCDLNDHSLILSQMVMCLSVNIYVLSYQWLIKNVG